MSRAHLTYLPRKPTPLGFQLKTLCDSSSNILLNMEVCEGRDADRAKQFADELGVTSATTLRLTRPFWSRGAIIHGDSWFGSLKTASELLRRGTFAVMNVKTATRGYPKNRIKEQPLERNQSRHFAVQVDIDG